MLDPTQDIFTTVLLLPTVPDRPGLVLLSWSSADPAGRVVQVYVNGQLYDVTTDPTQRELWMHLDRGSDAAVELLAVPIERAWEARTDLLAGWSPEWTTAASLTLIRDESLPTDSRVIVTLDGVDEPSEPLWTAASARSGFGGLLGIGEFGRDAATGPGLGLGGMGLAAFGADGQTWRWSRDDLAAGEHTLSLRVGDSRGLIVGGPAPMQTVTIDALSRPAKNLTIDRDFTLRWD